MLWLLIIVIIVVAAFAIPQFGEAALKLGKALLVMFGILVLIAVVWYFNNQHEEEISKTRISLSDIELDNLQLIPDYSPDSFNLVGRLKNKSNRYTLSSLNLKLNMEEISPTGQKETVGETTVHLWQDVPPGQVRDIKEHVYFSNLAATRGTRTWHYLVLEIKGK